MSVASKTSLSQFFRYCLEKKLPVAFYRLPDTDAVKIVAQKNSVAKKFIFSNETIGEKGFLFSPFQENEQWSKIMIQPDIFCDEENLPGENYR